MRDGLEESRTSRPLQGASHPMLLTYRHPAPNGADYFSTLWHAYLSIWATRPLDTVQANYRGYLMALRFKVYTSLWGFAKSVATPPSR